VKPKILLLDLETGFNILKLFSLYQPGKTIPYSAIQQERYIICGSIKEFGKDTVWSYHVKPSDPTNDKSVVAMLIKALEDADAVIAHNGDEFDLKYINTRAVYHGLSPLPNIKQIDTLKLARKKFNFNSNRLDYLGQFLKVGKKINAPQSLWSDALTGSAEAIDKLLKYNVQDVRLLEEVYKKIAPFCEASLNHALFAEEGEIVCPLCGSESYQKRGFVPSKTGLYQRYQCKECNHWFQGTTTILKTGVKSK